MTPTFKNPERCAALVVACLLAAARGELTLAQDLAPDPYFQPIADKSFPLMPPVILRSIREDRDGNIWFASFAGPIRYDGKAFTNFGEEAGIAGQRVFSLLVDKSGALWFGTVLSGVSRYDGKSFTRFTTKDGLAGDGVFWIVEDERCDIWFGTDGGVSRYDGKTFTNHSTDDALPHKSVHVIPQDRSGKLWFGTQEGIASNDGKTFTNVAGIAGREFQNIRSIVEDKAGNLWFGGQDGVYRYDGKTGTMLTAKDGLLEDFVGSMIVDKAGNVWFGHPGKWGGGGGGEGGATRYDGKTFTHFTQKEGLPGNVYCMLEDREGRIWFGSVGYGASRYDGKTFTNFSAPPLPKLRSAEPRTVPGLELTLMPIPAGSFDMGSVDGDADERLVTRVTISSDFWMGKTEVTQAQWRAIMGSNPSVFKGDDQRPVEGLPYNDMLAFCRKLTERERAAGRLPDGYAYALPTEAQWEYACRAGATGQYASDDLNAMAWYDANSGGQTHPVAQKQANAWGLHDMHGNVWEMCADRYADKLPGGSVRDYTGAPSGSGTTGRGGGCGFPAGDCRSSNRSGGSRTARGGGMGFRLALAPKVRR